MTSSGTFEYSIITSTNEADPFDEMWDDHTPFDEEDADLTLEDDYSEEDYE